MGEPAAEVVVGVGEPEESLVLVATATSWARKLTARLALVRAYDVQASSTAGQSRARAKAGLSAVVAGLPPRIRAQLSEADVLQGPTAHALVGRADRAALLVVGCHAPFHPRPGSVAEVCTSDATCPVLVVHLSARGLSRQVFVLPSPERVAAKP